MSEIDPSRIAGGPADDAELQLSLVDGDPLHRAQRALGLIPARGLGLARRALLLALLTWVPVAVWAFVQGRLLPGAAGEPLLQHFGIHVRCLIAIPLLVLAEGMARGVTTRLVPYFLTSGLIREQDRDAFRGVIRDVIRLRDSTRPWVVILAIVIAWAWLSPVAGDVHEIVWTDPESAPERIGFGGYWFLYVARPVYFALLMSWLWRVVLLFVLLRRISKLDLDLVPSHPDGVFGLAFVEGLPGCFSLVVLASAAVLASRWTHDVIYHGVHVDALRVPAVAFLVVSLVLFTGPLLAFLPKLAATRRRALLQYGALVGEQGRLVGRKWIASDPSVSSDLLSAPEIGPWRTRSRSTTPSRAAARSRSANGRSSRSRSRPLFPCSPCSRSRSR